MADCFGEHFRDAGCECFDGATIACVREQTDAKELRVASRRDGLLAESFNGNAVEAAGVDEPKLRVVDAKLGRS